MRKCSVSLVIKERQIEITMRYHFTAIRTATIKKKKITVKENVKKSEPLCTVGKTVKWQSHSGKQ